MLQVLPETKLYDRLFLPVVIGLGALSLGLWMFTIIDLTGWLSR
ncbi:hypothetical protein [Pseudorhodoplanes sp.]|nr:hypothetical protein [Pseudorhodoplanes sp.]HWV52034.1 hypothetical protein [Pseudorhodoplanes sp.]